MKCCLLSFLVFLCLLPAYGLGDFIKGSGAVVPSGDSFVKINNNNHPAMPAITGNYQLWVDTLHSSVSLSGSLVNSISDLSPNAYTLTGTGAGAFGHTSLKPTYNSAALNGLPTITLCAGNGGSWLQTTTNFALSGDPTATVFYVVKPKSITKNGGFFGFGNPGAALAAWGMAWNPLLGDTGFSGQWAGGNSWISNSGLNTSWQIIVLSKTPGAINSTVSMQYNSTSLSYTGTPSSSTPNVQSGYPFSIGLWSNYDGDVTYSYVEQDFAAMVVISGSTNISSDILTILQTLNGIYHVS